MRNLVFLALGVVAGCSVGTDGTSTTFGGFTGAPGTTVGPTTAGASTGASVGTQTGGSTGETTEAATGAGDGSGAGSGSSGAQAECGNGVIEPGEDCDVTEFGGQSCADFGFDAGDLLCNGSCKILTDGCFTCGDGTKDATEACDGGDFGGATCQSLGYGGGGLSCSEDCQSIDTSACTPLPTCGDGQKNGSEQCDGADLGGQTCQSQGFDSGTLSCNADCTLNTSNCQQDPNCAGQGEFCIFDENDPQSNCCPPGVKGNVLGICDAFICV